ncbi:unnamed protein product, partial [Iphiclides podalirius]
MMPDRESVGGPGTAGSGGFLPLQFPSAFAAFHAATPPGAQATAMHHATHYHHHAQAAAASAPVYCRGSHKIQCRWDKALLGANLLRTPKRGQHLSVLDEADRHLMPSDKWRTGSRQGD